MKVVLFLLGIIFVLFLPLLLVATNIRFLANEPRVYLYAFDKYGAEQNVGLDRQELVKVANAITSYFGSPGEGPLYIDVTRNGKVYPLFSAKEATHMADVKGLIHLANVVQATTLIYAVIYIAFLWFQKRNGFWPILSKNVAIGGTITLVLLALLGLGAIFGFSQLFLLFHMLSFQNNLWILDPATDNLIRMFPEEFFFDVTLLFVTMTVVEALVSLGFAIFVRSRNHKKETQDIVSSSI